MKKLGVVGMAAVFGCLLIAGTARPAAAIPVFAHRYGLSCQACHTEVPHLTDFGQLFLSRGYRLPGLSDRGTFPVAVRAQLAYASAGAADPDETLGPLPKTIVDEVEVLTGGHIGTRGSYWAEQYAVDGGFWGRTRDLWAALRVTPDGARLPVELRAGQFTLPLPLDPETFRETTQPYAIWSQTGGTNRFNFFDTKRGGQATIGDPDRGIAGSLDVLDGHDYAGFPSIGVDTMLTLQRSYGPWGFELYRYDGSRSLSGPAFGNTTTISNVGDRFWRNGYAASWHRNDTEIDAVYQNGDDTASDVYHDALQTSGGFLQIRQAFAQRAFAIARYDATQDTGFARTLTAGLGVRPTARTRLTVFETGERDFTGRYLNVLSSQFLFAY